MSQITTITFFKFQGFQQQWWGFKMMRDAHKELQEVAGQTFYKLMGSGRGRGFNPFPDWSVYSLLQVWENESRANQFFQEAPVIQAYRQNSTRLWTIFMHNIKAKGQWSDQEPFQQSKLLDPDIKQLAVLTRATIKPAKLWHFWRYVPASRQPLRHNDGLLFTKGIGEAPIIQMATFSLWKDEASLRQFAYESEAHRKAILKTKQLDWYSEELFARFQPYRMEGHWEETKTADLHLGGSRPH